MLALTARSLAPFPHPQGSAGVPVGRGLESGAGRGRLPSPGQRGGNPRGSALQRGLDAPTPPPQCRPPAPSLPCCLSKPSRLAGVGVGGRPALSCVGPRALHHTATHPCVASTTLTGSRVFPPATSPARGLTQARAVVLPFIRVTDEAVTPPVTRLPASFSQQ